MRHLYTTALVALFLTAASCDQTGEPGGDLGGKERGKVDASKEKDPTTETEKPESQSNEKVTADEVRREVGEATEAIQKYSAKQAAKLSEEARSELKELEGRISELRTDWEEMEKQGQSQLKQTLSELEAQAQRTENKLEELGQTGGKAWNQAADDLQKSLGNLQSAYEDAAAAFGQAEDGGTDSDRPTKNPTKSQNNQPNDSGAAGAIGNE